MIKIKQANYITCDDVTELTGVSWCECEFAHMAENDSYQILCCDDAYLEELYEDLKGVIFLNPHYEKNNIYETKYLTADEYLSGDVREKLSVARDIARVLGCKGKGDGCINGDKYVVTWALGHLVTLADPDAYDEKYKRSALTDRSFCMYGIIY